MITRSFLAVAASVLLSPAGIAHSWYPHRCCDDRDCFQADTLSRLPGGEFVLSRGRIVIRAPASFPIEPSPDGKMHICVFETEWGLEPRCIFLPPGW